MFKWILISILAIATVSCDQVNENTEDVTDETEPERSTDNRNTQPRENSRNDRNSMTTSRGDNGGRGNDRRDEGGRRESRRDQRPSIPWWENYGDEGAETWHENRSHTDEDDIVRNDGRGDWDGRGSGDASSGSDYVIVADDSEDIYTSAYSWSYRDNSMRNNSYNISIELTRDNINDAQDYINYMNQLAYYWDESLTRELDLDWNAGMEEIYIAICQEIYADDASRFDDIVAGFEEIFEAESMNDMQQLYFVITFIQNITYRQPGGGTDILPPTVTLAEKYGDCDTVSILAYLILDDLGFDVVMMASEMYGHAMLGVNATATGDFLEYEGKRYYFVELTYPDWWLGELDSSCNNTRYWYAYKLA